MKVQTKVKGEFFMEKIRVGVIGGYRGASMINYCKRAAHAEVVAICDKSRVVLDAQKEAAEGLGITFYDNFEDFIKHDMDAVVLANYANEHAPFAIRAMREGKHVYSEVLPIQTMAEAVALAECIEETGKIYAYGENYCYMPAPYEMKRLYRENAIGEFEYGECEYIHNCEPIWHAITYGEREHWRNHMYSTFYCTHSLGPIIHMTGLRPVSVIGFEGTKNERNLRTGALGGQFGIEMVTLENGAIIKSIHGGLYQNSIWYCAYGSKGRMESAREDAELGDVHMLYLNNDEYSGQYRKNSLTHYQPTRALDDLAEGFGHGSSDFYAMWHFIEKIKGNPEADIIDFYEALDMFLPGMFAYRSILDGGIPKKIPNLRNKQEREAYRYDRACTDPRVAGDQLLPTCESGTPDIEDAVYQRMYEIWIEDLKKKDGHTAVVLSQGAKKEAKK